MTLPVKTPLIVWVRLFLGIFLMASMGYIWVFVKEFELWLFVIPSALMGVAPADLFKKKK